MKNFISSCLFILIFAVTQGQAKYQEGYYITNNNERVTCLIEDANWSKNPYTFKFKKSEKEAVSQLGISDVIEFGILNKTKFVRQIVNLEISSNNLHKLSRSKTLERSEKEVFLKVLIEGEASLYEYSATDVKNFFYQEKGGLIQLLEYKRYIENSEVKFNENYKNQLFSTFTCEDITLKAVRKVDYEARNLSRFFEIYNTCKSSETTSYFKRQQEQLLIGIQPSLGSASLNLNFAADESAPLRNRLDAEFDNEIQFRFGVEFEYLFSFQKQKWSIFLAPLFQRYTSSTQALDTDNSTLINVEADYTSFEIASGIRHYMFLSDTSSLFLEGGVAFDFPISRSNIKFDTRNEDLLLDPNANFLFGLGYRYNKKYSILLRYQLNRDILKNSEAYEAKFSSISVLFTYYFKLNIANSNR